LIPPTLNLAITVYEGTDMDLIWRDRGSGANRDFSSWRAKGSNKYYSLGDIGVASHSRPRIALLVKATKQDALRAPTGYRLIWKDSGSGADWDVSFWEPICPPFYRAIGHVSVRRHRPQPKYEDVRCVLSKYTVQGKWSWIWNDRGSGADRDVGVWQANRKDTNGQGVNAMSTVASHGKMNRTPYVLKRSIVNYVIGKPAKKYILQNVEYFLDARVMLNQEPDVITTTVVINKGTSKQETTREISYSVEESYSWSNTFGLEVGVATEITAGVPAVAKTKVSSLILFILLY
jgi:hypothetical protein